VYGLLRTKDVASQVSVEQVMTSLICLIVVYGLIFGYFFMKYFFKVIGNGPEQLEIDEHDALAFNYMSTFKQKQQKRPKSRPKRW
jgi:cytochrome d ubiquinol oxidase subunit I